MAQRNLFENKFPVLFLGGDIPTSTVHAQLYWISEIGSILMYSQQMKVAQSNQSENKYNTTYLSIFSRVDEHVGGTTQPDPVQASFVAEQSLWAYDPIEHLCKSIGY